MPIFDATGLFEGRRLRKLSPLGHALWPFLFSLASERYARIEVDHELIVERMGHLKCLLDDGDWPELNTEACVARLAEILDEYAAQGLLFFYTVKDVPWAVFDKPNELRRDFGNAMDNKAPAPPEPAFTEWLKKVHGEDWEKFHPGRQEEELRAKRAEAGRQGGLASGRSRSKQTEANDDICSDLLQPASDSKQTKLGVRCLVSGSRKEESGDQQQQQLQSPVTVAPPQLEHIGAKPKPAPFRSKSASEIRAEISRTITLPMEERQRLIEAGEITTMLRSELSAAEQLADLWNKMNVTGTSSDPFVEFLYEHGVPSMFGPGGVVIKENVQFTDQYSYDRIACIMFWAFNTSDYWSKPERRMTAEKFCLTFDDIATQYDRYYAKADAPPHKTTKFPCGEVTGEIPGEESSFDEEIPNE